MKTKTAKPCLFLLVSLIFSLSSFAQESEYFVKISAFEETFETVSPIDGVQYVSYGRPAFSDDLGQYTFFQTVPEVAAITIDVEYGETLYYTPFPNTSPLLTPGDPLRVNDGRILATLFYVFSFDIFYFDPTLEEYEGVNLSYFPTQTGTQYIGFSEYNPSTNKFYFHHSDETTLNVSYITEVDVETGMVSNEITSNRIIHAMFATTDSSDLAVICNDEQSAGKQIGYLNTATGIVTPITTSLTFPWYYKASGSVDEENDWIYASSYTYEEGSKVNIIEFGTGDIEYNEHLILESEYSEDEWGFPAPDTSNNVINAYYSNIRKHLYGIHWGSGPLVDIHAYEQPTNWRLQAESVPGTYLLSGLKNEVSKNLSIFDTTGRLISSQD
ncbi:MAG: hypothetical protein GC193_04780, partial [Cryomorphaceae bacterium]|nr:hypothetical protein [Cryomorphaceae bacterium]